MHISVEGLDGVGKTTLAKHIAESLKFPLVEKPVHFLMKSDGDWHAGYRAVSDKINALPDSERAVKAWFYGLGILYMRRSLGMESFVTDRYLGSTYGWNGCAESEQVFDALVNLAGKPELTILDVCSTEARRERMRKRDPNDPDIFACVDDVAMNAKIESFYKKHGFFYEVIDTTGMDEFEAFETAMNLLRKHKLV